MLLIVFILAYYLTSVCVNMVENRLAGSLPVWLDYV